MQQTRPLDPLEFLGLARELGGRSEEAALRAAVGRAYYALFLLAREKLGIPLTTADVHSHVARVLRGQPGFWKVASDLRVLRALRNVADYQLMPDDPDDRDWSENWARAHRIVRRVLPKLQAL